MRTCDKHEAEPMLEGTGAIKDALTASGTWDRYRRFAFFQLMLITAYSITFLLVVDKIRTAPSTSLTPLQDMVIQYQPKLYADFEESVYSGLPSPRLDSAWHTMLEGITVRVTKSELERSDQTSVRLPNGGYMAWLGVSHELHCIKMLRQWIYRDHYHPNITDEDVEHWYIHADHCLEVLRSASLCHADTTLTTFRWAEKDKPMLNTKLIPHKCVNWNSLTNSVKHRVVESDEIAKMSNPLLNQS